MNTAAKWSCAVANKPQRQKQNVKKEKAFLGGKGIYLGSPVTPFFFLLSFLNNIFFSTFFNSLPVQAWSVFLFYKSLSFSKVGKGFFLYINFFIAMYFSPFFIHALFSMNYLFLPKLLFILNDLAQIPLPPPQSLSRLCLCLSSDSWNYRIIIYLYEFFVFLSFCYTMLFTRLAFSRTNQI